MPIRLNSLRQQHRWLSSLLVLAFALRALIPAGFMPGGNGELSLQICPDGFPATHLAGSVDHAAHHHHGAPDGPAHDHKSWMGSHCAFSAVASAPPLVHALILELTATVEAPRAQHTPTPVSLDFRHRIAQPRAPPRL